MAERIVVNTGPLIALQRADALDVVGRFDAAERLPNFDPRIVVVGYQMRKLPLTWSMPSM